MLAIILEISRKSSGAHDNKVQSSGCKPHLNLSRLLELLGWYLIKWRRSSCQKSHRAGHQVPFSWRIQCSFKCFVWLIYSWIVYSWKLFGWTKEATTTQNTNIPYKQLQKAPRPETTKKARETKINRNKKQKKGKKQLKKNKQKYQR